MRVRTRFPLLSAEGFDDERGERVAREEHLFDLILSSLWRVPRVAGGQQVRASRAERRRARMVPPRERWAGVALERRYKRLEVAAGLLDLAVGAERNPLPIEGEDSESLALLALHLAAGLDPSSFSGANLRDLMAEAWILVARARLHDGRQAGARQAAVMAQCLAEQGSEDPLLAFRLHLIVACTHWAAHARFLASAHLQVARELAAAARDAQHLWQAWVWISLFLAAHGRREGEERALKLAARYLGEAAPALHAELRRLSVWLRLPEVPSRKPREAHGSGSSER